MAITGLNKNQYCHCGHMSIESKTIYAHNESRSFLLCPECYRKLNRKTGERKIGTDRFISQDEQDLFIVDNSRPLNNINKLLKSNLISSRVVREKTIGKRGGTTINKKVVDFNLNADPNVIIAKATFLEGGTKVRKISWQTLPED